MKISISFVIDFTGSTGTTAHLRDTGNHSIKYTTKHLYFYPGAILQEKKPHSLVQLAQGIYGVCLYKADFSIVTSNSTLCVTLVTMDTCSESSPSNTYKSQILFLKIMPLCIPITYYKIVCKPVPVTAFCCNTVRYRQGRVLQLLLKSIKFPHLKFLLSPNIVECLLFIKTHHVLYSLLSLSIEIIYFFSLLSRVLYYLQKQVSGFPDKGRNEPACTLGSTMQIHSNVCRMLTRAK